MVSVRHGGLADGVVRVWDPLEKLVIKGLITNVSDGICFTLITDESPTIHFVLPFQLYTSPAAL